jgi:hypothetical protein
MGEELSCSLTLPNFLKFDPKFIWLYTRVKIWLVFLALYRHFSILREFWSPQIYLATHSRKPFVDIWYGLREK